jgi:hypothetical protein
VTEPAPLRSELGPYALIPRWVLMHPDLSGDDVRLYGVLADHADRDTSRCFPGQTLLAQQAHISVRTVRAAVERLESAGAVLCRRRWKDSRGTVWYESGPDRQQTSSEYIVKVTQPQGGGGSSYRHPSPAGSTNAQLQGGGTKRPTNKNHQEQLLGRHDVPPPLTPARKPIPAWEITS